MSNMNFNNMNPQERKKNSPKLRTETKNYIDKMLACGNSITKANIVKGMDVSRSFLNTPEIDTYIKDAAAKQMQIKINLEQQNSILFNKLMASYI